MILIFVVQIQSVVFDEYHLNSILGICKILQDGERRLIQVGLVFRHHILHWQSHVLFPPVAPVLLIMPAAV